VLDATATSPSPGIVIVSLLSRLGDGGASQQLVDIAQAYLSADTRRPLTDFVTVQSAEIVPYEIDYDLTTYNGPDAALVLASSLANVQAYCADSHRIGRDITLSALFRAAHVEGAQNVRFNSPTADILITRTQAPFCTNIAGRFAGTSE
jgi:phage-related baseplate assembly protein